MAKKNESNNEFSDRELIITRVINAPRELVFEVWTDARHIVNWWGPYGFTNTIKKMELKPGGIWQFIMHGPNGVDYPNKIVYQEILKPERLVYTHSADIENDPNEFEVSVTFQEKEENKTEITMCMIFVSAEERNKIVKEHGAVKGNQETFNRLQYYLLRIEPSQSEEEFSITEIINAPRELVFQLWTDPTHFLNWWMKKSEIKIMKLDLESGGVFHYGIETLYGETNWTKIIYQKIEKPTYLSYSIHTSDERGRTITGPLKSNWPLEILSEITFVEENGKTIVHIKERPVNATPKERKLFKETHQAMQISFDAIFIRLTEYVNTIL